jgi:hypothetical protein
MPETEACLSQMSTLTCACKGRGVGAFGRVSRPHRSPQSGPKRPSGASRGRRAAGRPGELARRAGLKEAKAGALWHRLGRRRRCDALSTRLACRDGEHLVHDADDGVRGGGDEALAEEARPTDADAHHA